MFQLNDYFDEADYYEKGENVKKYDENDMNESNDDMKCISIFKCRLTQKGFEDQKHFYENIRTPNCRLGYRGELAASIVTEMGDGSM
jgi:hypothetical protein